MTRLWQQLAEKGFYKTADLKEIFSRDRLAFDCARRFKAFTLKDFKGDMERAKNYALNPDSCFLSITWGDARKAQERGKITFKSSWCRANQTIWASPTKEFFEEAVLPLIERFTAEDLQGVLGIGYLKCYELVTLRGLV